MGWWNGLVQFHRDILQIGMDVCTRGRTARRRRRGGVVSQSEGNASRLILGGLEVQA